MAFASGFCFFIRVNLRGLQANSDQVARHGRLSRATGRIAATIWL
jgi:hypothetical protein